MEGGEATVINCSLLGSDFVPSEIGWTVNGEFLDASTDEITIGDLICDIPNTHVNE